MAADLETRIQQFKQMAEADPENELGHFSLGKAYLEAERFEDAIVPLKRATELNPKLSKAYQLLGEAYHRAGRRESAVEVMTKGVTIADHQGDRIPRDAMAAMLTELAATVPAFCESSTAETAGVSDESAASGFHCSRCGKPSGPLPKAPFKGPLGEKIHRNICQLCWREWVAMGTKVINELGLALSRPESQEIYDQHMVEFLMLEDR